jgi:pyruvate-formate lyase-activating enzyme
MIEAIIGNTNGCFSKKSIEPSCDLVLLFTLNLKPMSTNRENHSTLKEPEERF